MAGKSGISQACTRLGEAPLRHLYEQVMHPVAMHATKGAGYRAWRLVSLDGSCLGVTDTEQNRTAFERRRPRTPQSTVRVDPMGTGLRVRLVPEGGGA